MEIYSKCEYCPIIGDEERVKLIPFGNEAGGILFVLPTFFKPDDREKEMLVEMYPEAFFVGFIACYNVMNVQNAELSCSVILRNTSRHFGKIMAPDMKAIKSLYKVRDGITQKDNGLIVSLYKGNPLQFDIQKEYERLKNG